MVMMTNQYVYQVFEIGDPVRMGAQVISGIGFLGAGTIIVTGKNKIKGVTTAACLWAAACSGLAIGIGFYEGAILCGAVIVIIMSVFQAFDVWTRKKSKFIDVYIEYDSSQIPLSAFLEYAKENNFDVLNFQIHQEMGKNTSYTFSIMSNSRRTHAEMLLLLSEAKGVQYIEEL
jgi:putative Mg2+ transporter-C (MgtC) family protein